MDPRQPTGPDEVRTDAKAIWSLVLGILSITCFWVLTGIPAIILGHLSRSAIRQSMGRLKGEGMALAGLVFGYISVALVPVLLIVATIMIPGLLRSRQAANEASAIANLRTIGSAEVSLHAGPTGKYADLEGLIDAKLIDESFRETMSGYNFSVAAGDTGYTATATPATPNTGRWGYFVTSEGVIRYSSEGFLAPPGQAGLPAN